MPHAWKQAIETAEQPPMADARDRRTGLAAAGGVLGTVAASSCCILPLVLFSVGAGGAWIGILTALAPYQPVIIAVTAAFLGYGYYRVYRTQRNVCDGDAACARPVAHGIVKLSLIGATVLVAAAGAFPFVAPYLLDY